MWTILIFQKKTGPLWYILALAVPFLIYRRLQGVTTLCYNSKSKWQRNIVQQCATSIPTSTNHNTTTKVNIFVKNKNVPKVLKCKINHYFFSLTNMGFPNWGEGWGSLTWEKFPHFPGFSLALAASLSDFSQFQSSMGSSSLGRGGHMVHTMSSRCVKKKQKHCICIFIWLPN